MIGSLETMMSAAAEIAAEIAVEQPSPHPALPALTALPAAGAPEPDDVDTLITALRSRIDDVDRALVTLLQERRALSRRVQDARIAAGGVRVELAREREIVDTYREALGSQGVALATALLRTCRGPL